MLQIRDLRVDALARQLAKRRKSSMTEAVRVALENELARMEAPLPLRERLSPLIDRLASRPRTGAKADKGFFDELGGEA